jgi:hypothetical protein
MALAGKGGLVTASVFAATWTIPHSRVPVRHPDASMHAGIRKHSGPGASQQAGACSGLDYINEY